MKRSQKVLLKDNDKKVIAKAVSILKLKFPVIEIKLFGSKVKGSDTPESDIDLLVLTSKPLSWTEKNAMTDSLYEVQIKYDVIFSLLVVLEKDWRSGLYSILPIHDEIEKYGIAA